MHVMEIIEEQKLVSHNEPQSPWESLWSKKYLKKIAIFQKVTLESRVRYQVDMNFQHLSEIVKAAITLNEKALYYDRRIKINQKRLMNC